MDFIGGKLGQNVRDSDKERKMLRFDKRISGKLCHVHVLFVNNIAFLFRVRPDSFTEGCELNTSCKKIIFEVEDECRVHLLALWTVCLGDAEDEPHVIAVESAQTEGQQVIIASLQPSRLPMINVYGLELTSPVEFHLTCGSGPVYISGQHITLDDHLDLSHRENGHLGSCGNLTTSVVSDDKSEDENAGDKPAGTLSANGKMKSFKKNKSSKL